MGGGSHAEWVGLLESREPLKDLKLQSNKWEKSPLVSLERKEEGGAGQKTGFPLGQ